MTKASPEVEQLAAERLAADESPAARRRSLSLGEAWSEFVRHPSPWMIGAFLLGSVVGRGSSVGRRRLVGAPRSRSA